MTLRWNLWASLCFAFMIPGSAINQSVQQDLDRSEHLFLNGRFDDALALLDKVALTASALNDPAASMLVASKRSTVEFFRGLMTRDRTRYPAVLEMLSSQQQALSEVQDPDVKGTFMTALAYAHLANGHRDTALVQFQEAIDLLSKGADRHGAAQAKALDIMVRVNRHRSNRDTTAMLDMVPIFEAEIDLARQAGNLMALAYNQRHLGAVYREASGDLEKSLSLYRASLDTRIQLGFRPLIPASYSSVGDVLADLGRTEAAIEMYERSLSSAEQVGFRRYLFIPRIKVGDLLQAEGKWNLARSYYTAALQAAQAEDFQAGIDQARRKLENLD